jgi:hypothetical protein
MEAKCRANGVITIFELVQTCVEKGHMVGVLKPGARAKPQPRPCTIYNTMQV